MSVLSPETLTHLEDLLQAATPGEWYFVPEANHSIISTMNEEWSGDICNPFLRVDTELIVAAVNALPALLQAVRERGNNGDYWQAWCRYFLDEEEAARLALERAERAEREVEELRDLLVLAGRTAEEEMGRSEPDRIALAMVRDKIARYFEAALGRVEPGESQDRAASGERSYTADAREDTRSDGGAGTGLAETVTTVAAGPGRTAHARPSERTPLDEQELVEDAVADAEMMEASAGLKKELAAEVAQLRPALEDAHHEMSTIAGLLRLDGQATGATQIVHLGNRLAEECARVRAALVASRPGQEQEKCHNGPDEQGNYPCDPVENGDGTASCSVCGWTGRFPVREQEETTP